jgi:hypothetical protein
VPVVTAYRTYVSYRPNGKLDKADSRARRQNAAQGVSPGSQMQPEQAPKGRKEVTPPNSSRMTQEFSAERVNDLRYD